MPRARVRVLLTRPPYRPVVARKQFGNDSGSEVGEGKTPSIEGGPSPNLSGDGGERNSVASLLDQAATLSKVEQQELLDHLALQQQLTRKASDSRDLDMWSAAVGTALGAAIGDDERGSYGQLLIKRLLGSTSCWRPVEAFMTSSKLSELRVVERQAVYNLLAELLVDHAGYVARKSGAPLGPKLIGQCTGSLPGVFEASFPGYLAAGLAPIVARQMSPRSRAR